MSGDRSSKDFGGRFEVRIGGVLIRVKGLMLEF